jgi:hypothetical protein
MVQTPLAPVQPVSLAPGMLKAMVSLLPQAAPLAGQSAVAVATLLAVMASRKVHLPSTARLSAELLTVRVAALAGGAANGPIDTSKAKANQLPMLANFLE